MHSLVSFGWNDFFANEFTESATHEPARVIAEHRGLFRIQTGDSETRARVAGKLRHEATDGSAYPAVGDWVTIQRNPHASEQVIDRILPRKSKFSRQEAGQRTAEQVIAANIDVVWIVCGVDRDFNPRRIERYLTLAWESGAQPVVVLTKADVDDAVQDARASAEAIAIGASVHLTSSVTGEGLDSLTEYFANHATVALLGSSGVGKSSLINALCGIDLQAIGEVRHDGKGRHTTTHRQLIQLPQGGLIIDTPGMRELQLWGGQDGVGEVFSDIDELAAACRFSDCRHAGEPGCAVAAAVEDGSLPAERIDSYHKLQKEAAHWERKNDARAQREQKQQWKSIMKSMKKHPKYRGG